MITWKLPKTDEPGFLKRRREISELLDLTPTPENSKTLTDYLQQFVEEGDVEDCTQDEYSHAIMVLLGLETGVEPKKGGRSVPQ